MQFTRRASIATWSNFRQKGSKDSFGPFRVAERQEGGKEIPVEPGQGGGNVKPAIGSNTPADGGERVDGIFETP